jgi:drug/metabolite transporter (DMT)-like permease
MLPAALISTKSLNSGTPDQDKAALGGTSKEEGEEEEDWEKGHERGRQGGRDSVWQSGIELGVYTFAGYAMQSIGLQYTSASRSAFLLYLNVKLVPLLGLVLYGRSVSGKAWLNVCVALAGTLLLG